MRAHPFVLLSLLLASRIAEATSSRVFVAAKTGNDSNACNSVATPCLTFAGAIAQVVAGGEIIVLESGGYGPVTINHSITIHSPSGIVAFIHPSSGDAVTINAGATDTVILRGLTLNGGAGSGINANSVGRLFVEHCTITGYATDGILFTSAGGTLFMGDDDVRECTGNGLAMGTGVGGTGVRAFIRGSSFVGNGAGVNAIDGSRVMITNSLASGNLLGFAASSAGGTTDMVLDHVQAVFNSDAGIIADNEQGGTATVRFCNSTVTGNGIGIGVAGTPGVFGTSPATTLVSGNTVNNVGTLGTAKTLE